MKTPSERGVTGAWAYLARQEAGLSVEQVADQMAAKGVTVSAATIRGIESGSKKPGARMLRALSAVLESVPPGAAVVRDEQADANSRLADAAERQAAAAERQAAASERQAAAMELHVAILARQTMATEAIAAQQGATLPTGPEMTRAEDALLAYGQSLLDRMLSQALLVGPLPAPEG